MNIEPGLLNSTDPTNSMQNEITDSEMLMAAEELSNAIKPTENTPAIVCSKGWCVCEWGGALCVCVCVCV